MIVKLPLCLFILLVSAMQPEPDEQLRREAFTRRALAWRSGGTGKVLPVAFRKAAHQLAAGPLTCQPILNMGLDSGREGTGCGHLRSYNLGSEHCRSFDAFRVFPEASPV